MKPTIIQSHILPFLAGALLVTGAYTLGKTAAPIPPLPPPGVTVYDCANIQHAPPVIRFDTDHPARYALIRLHHACGQQEAAPVLVQIWAADPAAGEVPEP